MCRTTGEAVAANVVFWERLTSFRRASLLTTGKARNAYSWRGIIGQMNNRSGERPTFQGGCTIAAAIVFLATAFPLSGGPTVAIFKHMNWSPWIIQTIYGPVFTILEICPPLGRAYVAYWNWWAGW